MISTLNKHLHIFWPKSSISVVIWWRFHVVGGLKKDTTSEIRDPATYVESFFVKFLRKMRTTWIWRPFSPKFLRFCFENQKKTCIPPFESKISGEILWLCPHTHTSRGCVHACTYVHRVVRASVACVSRFPKVFGQISPKFGFWRRNLAKILEKELFFGAARRASPKG